MTIWKILCIVCSFIEMNVKILSEAIQICLSWKFYSFDLSSFDNKWRKVLEYKDLMTNTDIISINSLIEVIEILKPYAGRKENERTRILVRAQQTLLGAQKRLQTLLLITVTHSSLY